ncbi:MAG: DUF4421 domain-containing protein [Bacteroidaceae bacterium]|nr:DUF4421 domain-containing protein [Bacteroidaceae bacterium]
MEKEAVYPNSTDSLYQKPNKGLFKTIANAFSASDTTYISPNKYVFSLMLENSNWYEYYRFSSTSETPQTLSLQPDMKNKFGVYFGWKWIFLGYSINLDAIRGNSKPQNRRTEFGLSLYSSLVGCDIYYRKSGTDFTLLNSSDFYTPNEVSTKIDQISGITVDVSGVNVYFIFNHKKFSYPAAYSQSTNQKRSVGSFIAGFSYTKHNIKFDYQELPSIIRDQLDDGLKFKQLVYRGYNVSAGYGYNWVFAKNCLFNLTLMPAIAYKRSNTSKESTAKEIINNFNFDFTTRAGITYNNTKYYVGASLLMHTYDYRTDKFAINNNFGTIRIYFGFNFLRKKK